VQNLDRSRGVILLTKRPKSRHGEGERREKGRCEKYGKKKDKRSVHTEAGKVSQSDGGLERA